MGDTVKCAFCGVLEDWEDFHVWGCEVCGKVFCDDCAPAGSDPMNPRKLILCPECAAKQQGVDLGCWLRAHGIRLCRLFGASVISNLARFCIYKV